MNFSEALTLLKNGSLVNRSGWGDPDQFLYLVPGSTFKVNRAPLLGIFPEGTEVSYSAHVDIHCAGGVCRPYHFPADDVLATDWRVRSPAHKEAPRPLPMPTGHELIGPGLNSWPPYSPDWMVRTSTTTGGPEG